MDCDDGSLDRRTFVAGAAAAGALAASGADAAPDRSTKLRGVDPYRVYDPAFECVRVALSARGERYSPSYIQGISGSGFRIGGPCPCAPTCTAAMTQADLVRLLGYEAEPLKFGEQSAYKTRLAEVLSRIKSEVRAGRPVIVFHAFTSAEWDVVCGFDEEKHELLGRGAYESMRGSTYARADEGRMITCEGICPPIGALVLGRKVGRFDARKAELAALREAARHARDTARKDYPYDGLAVYDRWQEHWRAADAKPDWLRDGYICAVYSSTHAAGADFLRQMARKHRASAAPLRIAADRLAAEAATLHGILAMLFPGEAKPRPEPEPTRTTMRKMLAEARAAYAAMADALDAALRRIET